MSKDLQDLTVEESLNRAKKRIIEMMKMKTQLIESEDRIDKSRVNNLVGDDDIKKVINDARNFTELIRNVKNFYRALVVFITERNSYRVHTHQNPGRAPTHLDGEYLNNVRRVIEGSNKIIHDLVDIVKEIKDLGKANLTEVDDSDLNDLVKYITILRDEMGGMMQDVEITYPIGNTGTNRANDGLTLFERTPGLNETIKLLGESIGGSIIILNQIIDYLNGV